MPNNPCILLVDTQPGPLDEIAPTLHPLEADFLRAETLAQAVELADRRSVAAAVLGPGFLSPGLPGSGDWSALRGLVEQFPTLPVIVLFAAYPDEDTARQAYAAGASDILCLPIPAALLTQKLEALLALYHRREASSQPLPALLPQENAQALFAWLSRSMEQIGLAMATALDMLEVPNMVLEQLAEVVPYERGSILLREENSLRIVVQRGFPPGWPVSDARIAIRPGDIFQQIMQTHQPLLIDDVMRTSAWSQAEGLPVNHSWLGVPLVSKGQVIGMVSLTRRDVAAFRHEEVAFIRASASQAAVALVNARLLNDLKRFNEQLEMLVQERTEDLKKAFARLAKIDQTKSSFISVAAHELRTPLTLIKGYATLLQGLVAGNQEAAELVEGILNGEKRLLDVVNSMIDVSKIDSQALTARKNTLNLWIILKIIRSEYEMALQERNIRLDILRVDRLPPIQADTDLISKLLRHLIGNAIKYTPDGGAITIDAQPTILVGAPPAPETGGDDNAVEITIQDTGIGIDPENHELIFDKFYQTGPVELHSSGKTKFKGGGSGLGLSIARGIVQAHGGLIWVESPGHDEARFPGSCFHVILPIH